MYSCMCLYVRYRGVGRNVTWIAGDDDKRPSLTAAALTAPQGVVDKINRLSSSGRPLTNHKFGTVSYIHPFIRSIWGDSGCDVRVVRGA